MATEADFTQDEWTDLSTGPTGLVLWIASIEPGFMDRVKESWAASQAVVKGASTELQRELAKPAKPDFAAGSLDEQKAGVLGALSRAVGVLQAKAPEEVAPYRAWIVSIADAVAQAADPVTPGEAEAVAAVKASMGV